jgi:lysophospholipid acyltransferase
MSPHAKANALTKLPSPLTFLAYALDPTTVLIGPFLEFQQHTEFLYARGVWAERMRPHGLFVAARSAGTTVVLAAAHVFLSGHFSHTLYSHARWAEFPLWYKCLCIYLIPLQARLKYYFSWSLTLTGLQLSGAAYEGAATGGWLRGQNVRPLGVELATSAVAFPANWNICTGNWLRNYVYDRAQPYGKKPGFYALLVTQTVSGVWHGLYAGYWLFFVHSAFMLQGSRFLFKLVSAAPKSLQPALRLAHGLVSSLQLNYLAVAFLALEWGPTMNVWRSINFAGHFVMAAIILSRWGGVLSATATSPLSVLCLVLPLGSSQSLSLRLWVAVWAQSGREASKAANEEDELSGSDTMGVTYAA